MHKKHVETHVDVDVVASTTPSSTRKVDSSSIASEQRSELDPPTKTCKPIRTKAVGVVREATLKLAPKRRRRKEAKQDGTLFDPTRPLHSLPHELLLEWGKACGFFFNEKVAKEVFSTLLELDREKAIACEQ